MRRTSVLVSHLFIGLTPSFGSLFEFLLVQSNRILLFRPPMPVSSYLDSFSIQLYAAQAWEFFLPL